MPRNFYRDSVETSYSWIGIYVLTEMAIRRVFWKGACSEIFIW